MIVCNTSHNVKMPNNIITLARPHATARHGHKPYKFMQFGGRHGHNTYKFIRFGGSHGLG